MTQKLEIRKEKHSGLQVDVEREMCLQDQTSINTYVSYRENITVALEIASCVCVLRSSASEEDKKKLG